MTAPAEIRSEMRARRRALAESARATLSAQLTRNVVRTPLFLCSQRIACYLPNDGEIDTHHIIRRIWSMKKKCFLPVLSTLHHNRLWFAPYRKMGRKMGQKMGKLMKNSFGIDEPIVPPGQILPAKYLDLVLVPLVAFDDSGGRLGMGGGFYDRTFAFRAQRRFWHKPRLIGIAYEFQRVGALPRRAWDVPLDGIITESAYYNANYWY